ncbi:MAG: FkbM family methyltransferase [Oscillochloris sp.]|nr:FkbM family methyltransferase [Oscillochloris sp.]
MATLAALLNRCARLLLRHRATLRRMLPLQHELLLRLPEFTLYVRLDDWVIGARIALRRTYEPHVSAVFRDLVRPAMHVIDIGSNIGYYSIQAAVRVGSAGRVIACEPDPTNNALLARSVAANQLTNVTLIPCAVADRTTTCAFVIDDSNGRLVDSATPQARIVQAVALDPLLAAERVDLIKMDIEGAEGLALAGMEQMINTWRPVIITEFSPGALQRVSHLTPEQFLARLRSLGYNLRVIDHVHGVPSQPESDAEIMAHFAATHSEHLDLLAQPGEKPAP